MRDPLSNEQIEEALKSLDGWRYEENSLQKTFTLKDFRAAMSFLVRLSYYAEELNHHPEIHNVYNRVDLSLSTHDAGNQVTEMDMKLARAIEGFSWV